MQLPRDFGKRKWRDQEVLGLDSKSKSNSHTCLQSEQRAGLGMTSEREILDLQRQKHRIHTLMWEGRLGKPSSLNAVRWFGFFYSRG